jgi:hypothetical protein
MGLIDAYAAPRRRTAAVITHTNTAPEPKLVVEEVLRAIEGPTACDDRSASQLF